MTAVNMSEDAAIRATIQHYLDGARLGKGDLMKPAFAEGATIFGYVGPDLFAGPIQGLSTGMTKTARPKTSSRPSPASK